MEMLRSLEVTSMSSVLLSLSLSMFAVAQALTSLILCIYKICRLFFSAIYNVALTFTTRIVLTSCS